jgi:hypothetical protein
MYVQLDKSDREGKKYKAVFYDNQRQKIITTHFGQRGANDYTLTHDDEAKQRYIERHKNNENWNDFTSSGSLARWLLWNKKSISASYNDYLKKFNLKKY